ncbi:DCN1-like protein [Seminavis robusta]|uniref:Defective in cullin neddylation protein n=1 Tax=Seminavis robusta TaxID=568900 RepID=A0A9N8HKL0_9STRA|nr:DCN1-like protein [Seminavis robusta]|eukprot:Sro763_g198920.1 DCN1-like protein (244) ;mRNA; f:31338-32258
MSNPSNAKSKRKRKSATSKSSNNMWSSSSKKKRGSSTTSSSGLNTDNAEKLFQEIADEDDDQVAGMEGISQLCEKLDIDPLEDLRVLVLLWKMGANEKPAQISKQEWMQGCAKLNVDSIAKFQNILPSLDTGFLDQTEFKDFYKFCFQFNRQGTHRTLDKELVVALIKMVLKERIPKDRLDSFCDFVESQESYTRITLDQWTSFLDFCYECEDLSSYDESTSAWPVLIDEYVEFMEERAKNKK